MAPSSSFGRVTEIVATRHVGCLSVAATPERARPHIANNAMYGAQLRVDQPTSSWTLAGPPAERGKAALLGFVFSQVPKGEAPGAPIFRGELTSFLRAPGPPAPVKWDRTFHMRNRIIPSTVCSPHLRH